MPVRRLTQEEALARLSDLERASLANSRPARRSIETVGYLYNDNDKLSGYIKIRGRAFNINAFYDRDMSGDFLIIRFEDEWFESPAQPEIRIYRAGERTFTGYIYYPSNLLEDVEREKYSFSDIHRLPWKGEKKPYFKIRRLLDGHGGVRR